jgi:hypothetical protein
VGSVAVGSVTVAVAAAVAHAGADPARVVRGSEAAVEPIGLIGLIGLRRTQVVVATTPAESAHRSRRECIVFLAEVGVVSKGMHRGHLGASTL